MDNSTGYKLTIGLLRAVAHLPLRVLYILSDIAFFVLFYVVRYRRKMVRGNLRKALPDASERELAMYERGFYRHLCDVFIEAVKLLHISDEEADRRIKVYGTEGVDEAIRGGQSVVVMLGHYGNWEWVPAVMRHISEPVVSCQIYHPLSNKIMDQVMLTIRSRFGSESIPMARTVRRLFEIERDGGHFICGFIADQRPFTRALPHWTTFMGLDTPYVTGGETIGDRVGAAFFYLDVEKPSRGNYRLTFKRIEPLTDGAEFPITRSYLKMLEETIKRDPRFWLWSHNRWKRKKKLQN